MIVCCMHHITFYSQTVTVTVEPPGTCLSSDSSFTLSAGVGTFMGSICEPHVNGIRIRFSTNSTISASVFNSSWSPSFNVTGRETGVHRVVNAGLFVCAGNFLIGGFFSVYADLLVTVMAQAAVELINSGRSWEPDFAGTCVSCPPPYTSLPSLTHTSIW